MKPPQNPSNLYIVPEEWDGKRIDLFLSTQDSDHSRGYIQKLITDNKVKLNEQLILKSSHLLHTGDAVQITEYLPEQAEPKGEKVSLNILYEDDDVLVINKPSDLTVHPTPNRSSGTLVNALLYHSLTIAEAVYDVHSLISRMRPGIVHRLDKDTSGVMIVAKNREALLNLAEQFQNHTVTKEYQALVYGSITEPTTVRLNIRRKPARQNMMGVSLKPGEGREAVTHLTPVEQYSWPRTDEEVTLLTVRIETGRTHQIRVHCKFLGHPVLGDPIYTNKPAKVLSEALRVPRHMLHASRLTFRHPKTEKELTVTAAVPPDMHEVLTKLERT